MIHQILHDTHLQNTEQPYTNQLTKQNFDQDETDLNLFSSHEIYDQPS